MPTALTPTGGEDTARACGAPVLLVMAAAAVVAVVVLLGASSVGPAGQAPAGHAHDHARRRPPGLGGSPMPGTTARAGQTSVAPHPSMRVHGTSEPLLQPARTGTGTHTRGYTLLEARADMVAMRQVLRHREGLFYLHVPKAGSTFQITITCHVCGRPLIIDSPSVVFAHVHSHTKNRFRIGAVRGNTTCTRQFVKFGPGHYPLPPTQSPPEPLWAWPLAAAAEGVAGGARLRRSAPTPASRRANGSSAEAPRAVRRARRAAPADQWPPNQEVGGRQSRVQCSVWLVPAATRLPVSQPALTPSPCMHA